jgi:hypothetical protein
MPTEDNQEGDVAAMTTQRDRVISVSLTEAEWQAFIARHPQPVEWIREQILAQLEGAVASERETLRGLGPSGPWSSRRV